MILSRATSVAFPVTASASHTTLVRRGNGNGNGKRFSPIRRIGRSHGIVVAATAEPQPPKTRSDPIVSHSAGGDDPSATTFTRMPSPAAYFRGQAGFSRFYPPEARDFKYSRHLMVAIDGGEATEAACEWTVQNLCRSGDLLHIIHVATPDNISLYSGPPAPLNLTTGYPSGAEMLSAEAQDAYWRMAVERTESILERTMDKVRASRVASIDAALVFFLSKNIAASHRTGGAPAS